MEAKVKKKIYLLCLIKTVEVENIYTHILWLLITSSVQAGLIFGLTGQSKILQADGGCLGRLRR
jgi:hypothetical protein